MMTREARPASERFWSKVDQSGGPDACWPYMGARKYGTAYGRFRAGPGRVVTASVFAYEDAVGPRNGLCVLHACDNPPCCNPAHLSLGTVKANTQDMIAKGRAAWQGVCRAHVSIAGSAVRRDGRTVCRFCGLPRR